jgi:hypothetical protein
MSFTLIKKLLNKIISFLIKIYLYNFIFLKFVFFFFVIKNYKVLFYVLFILNKMHLRKLLLQLIYI